MPMAGRRSVGCEIRVHVSFKKKGSLYGGILNIFKTSTLFTQQRVSCQNWQHPYRSLTNAERILEAVTK